MAEMSWRNIMRRFVRNVMTGSFTNAVSYIVKSAVNRKLSNRNVIQAQVPPLAQASITSDKLLLSQVPMNHISKRVYPPHQLHANDDQTSSQSKQTQHWKGRQ
jgi:hypothetical protein